MNFFRPRILNAFTLGNIPQIQSGIVTGVVVQLGTALPSLVVPVPDATVATGNVWVTPETADPPALTVPVPSISVLATSP